MSFLTVCVGIPWPGNRKEHTDPSAINCVYS